MISFLLDSANLPFSIAIGLMISIGLLEGVTTLMGAGASGLLDSILPDFDMDAEIDLDVDADADVDIQAVGSASALSKMFAWIHLGRIPVLILFLIFLFGFGMGGMALQYLLNTTIGWMLPAIVAVFPAFFMAILVLRYFGGLLIRYLPGNETQAVSESSFVGRIAVVTLGTAKRGAPAQARLRDEHGQSHYVMVEPESEASGFAAGDEVLLIGRKGSVFQVVENQTGISFNDINGS